MRLTMQRRTRAGDVAGDARRRGGVAAAPWWWTWDRVEGQLREAIRTVAALPDREQRWLRGNGSAMPRPVRSYWEAYSIEDAGRTRPGPPDARRISEMDTALGWLFWLDTDRDRAVVLARAGGVGWAPICARVGLGRTQAWKGYKEALAAIADRLNAEGVKFPLDGVNKT
jgi:hypothetical protein